MRRVFKKLDNPFLLTAEGFLAGALIFWATAPASVQAEPNRPAAQLEAPAAPAFSL